MDNFHIDVTTDNWDSFAAAIRIAFNHAPGAQASHYAEIDDRLILYWTSPDNFNDHNELRNLVGEGSHSLSMNADAGITFIKKWLESGKPSTKSPNIDGSVGRAFRIYNEQWGHVLGDWHAFAAIERTWALYGK